ncbi:MAG: hypothetical protein V3U82_00465 [Robiginitomaculum sp.]
MTHKIKISKAVFASASIVALSAAPLVFASAHPHGKDKAAPSIEIAPMPEDGALGTPSTAMPAATAEIVIDDKDFNIEDFLDENGQVDLDKLRAFENGVAVFEQEIEVIDLSNSPDGDEDMTIIFESEGEHGDHFGPIDLDAIKDAISEGAIKESGSGKHIMVFDLSGKNAPARSSRSAISRLLSNNKSDGSRAHKDHANSNGGPSIPNVFFQAPPRATRPAPRTITLSGETIIEFGENGSLKIINNGQSVIPLNMTAGHSGAASAMVIDGGAPAKVSVNKSISIEDGKRKVRVVIDMTGDIQD